MNVIAREPSQPGPIKRLIVDGVPVIRHYDLILSLLKLSLDEKELGIFAEPVFDGADAIASWRARSGNPLVSIREVTPRERMLLIKQCDKIFRKIEAQVDELRARSESGQVAAEVLAAALVTPDKYASMFTDGSGPVLIDWGSTKDVEAEAAIVAEPEIEEDPELTIVEVAPEDLEDARMNPEEGHAPAPVIPEDVITWSGDAAEALDDDQPAAAWRRRASAMNVATGLGAVAFLVVLVSTGVANLFSSPETEPQASTGELAATDTRPATELALGAPAAEPATPAAVSEGSQPSQQAEDSLAEATAAAAAVLPDSEATASEQVAALSPAANDAREIAPSLSPIPGAKSAIGLWGDEPVVASVTPQAPSGTAIRSALPQSQAALGPITDGAVRTGAPQAPDEGVGATLASWNPESIPALRRPTHPSESELTTLLDQAKTEPGEAPSAAFDEVPADKAALSGASGEQSGDQSGSENATASAASSEPKPGEAAVNSTRMDPAETLAHAKRHAGEEQLAKIENGLGLRRSDRRELQRRLLLMGYDPRGVDGVFGSKTRFAISQFQKSHGYPVTGYLDPAQIGLIERLSDERYAAWRSSTRTARSTTTQRAAKQSAETQRTTRQAILEVERLEQPRERQPRQEPVQTASVPAPQPEPEPEPEPKKRKRGFLGLFGITSADPDSESTGFGDSPDNDRGGGDGGEGAGDASGGGGAGGGAGGGSGGGSGSGDGGSGDGGSDGGGSDGGDGGSDGGDGGSDGGDGGSDGGDGGSDGGDGGSDGGDGGGDGGSDGGDGGSDGGSDGGGNGGGGNGGSGSN